MNDQDKTKEQLLKEIDQLSIENADLKKFKHQHKKVVKALNVDRKLYLDLATTQPSGIYRLRVFSAKSLTEEKWNCSKQSPVALEFFNDRFCKILKQKRRAIKNNPCIVNDLVFEHDKTEFIQRNIEANLKTIPFLWEGRFVIDGEILWVHFESLPKQLKCGDTLWTGFLYDITRQKNAELEIKLINEELIKINAEKDKFFTIISHDLRNPFNSIVGFSEILISQIKKNDLKLMEKYAKIILLSSRRVMDLITNLMKWAHSQTGRMIFNPEFLEMANLIDETVALFTDILEHKSITLTQETTTRALVFADKAMISMVLRNLISNAIKFTQTGGAIIISTEEKQDELIVQISDNGVGISKDTIKKLFTLTENLSTPGTNNEQGTGLGLILCKEFVHKHNGKIWVDSEVGKGSIFYFSIPTHQVLP